jgi:hypothetical protein
MGKETWDGEIRSSLPVGQAWPFQRPYPPPMKYEPPPSPAPWCLAHRWEAKLFVYRTELEALRALSRQDDPNAWQVRQVVYATNLLAPTPTG